MPSNLEHLPNDATCVKCQYLLRGLPEAVCAECGRVFDPEDPQTYAVRHREHWLHRRWAVLPACVVAYSSVCLGVYYAPIPKPPDSFYTAMVGPAILIHFWGVLKLFGILTTLCCAVLICAHPVRPSRGTAILTALGFLLWYVFGRIAWRIVAGV